MKLSDKDVVQIIEQRAQRTPLKQLAEQYQVDRKTIFRRIKAAKQTGQVGRKKVECRKKKYSEAQITQLERLAENHPFVSWEYLKYMSGEQISVSTISRYLQAKGIKKYVSPQKFLYTEAEKEERLQRSHSTLLGDTANQNGRKRVQEATSSYDRHSASRR